MQLRHITSVLKSFLRGRAGGLIPVSYRTLVQILAHLSPEDGEWACPIDVPGCRLQWDASGLNRTGGTGAWVGHLGVLTPTQYALLDLSRASNALTWSTPSGDVLFGGAVRNKYGILRTALNRRLRLVTFGYSIDNFASSTAYSLETLADAIPASGTLQPTYNGTKIGAVWSNKNIQIVGSCGISGETTTQMLARSAATASTTRKSLYDCLSLRGDATLMCGPLVNDGQLWDVGTTQATVDAAIDRSKIIISELARSVRNVGFVGCMGLTRSDWSAEKKYAVQGWLDYAVKALAAWAKATFDNVYFLDPEGRLSVRQAWIPANTTDGIHPNGVGGAVWAQMVNEWVDDLFTCSISDPVVYDWHKQFATVVSGRPTNVGAPTATGSSVIGTPTTANGVWSQPFTTVSATGGLYFQLPDLLAGLRAADLKAGDAWYMELDLEVVDANGDPVSTVAVESFPRLYTADNAGSYLPTMSSQIVPAGHVGWCTPVIKLDRDASGLGSSTTARITVSPGAIGTFTLNVTAPKLRKYVSALAT